MERDDIAARLRELERQAGALDDTFRILKLSPDVFDTLQVAALKRGSRRPHGGLAGFR